MRTLISINRQQSSASSKLRSIIILYQVLCMRVGGKYIISHCLETDTVCTETMKCVNGCQNKPVYWKNRGGVLTQKHWWSNVGTLTSKS